MPVPNTNTFSLNDVRLEIGLGTTASLSQCFSNANSAGFDPTYEGVKDRLSNFRNYDHSGGGPALTAVRLGYNTFSDSSACSNYDPIFSPQYYIDSIGLLGATKIYTNSSGTQLAANGWYADGNTVRNWNGSAFSGGGFCGGGFP